MIHALAYVVFILIFTSWVGRELNKKYSLKTHWLWIAAAVISTLIGSFIYAAYDYDKFSNFALHMSGGISATFLFVYLAKTLKLKLPNWRVVLIILFAWTSMLGVLNELAEYFFELAGLDTFAFDTHDTWRDLVANSAGMAVAYATLKLFRIFDNK